NPLAARPCGFDSLLQHHPTLKNLLAKYEGRVSLAYRDFPLREVHPQAQLAAEASRCAGEQGKLWEYHDLLFANPGKLNREDLLEDARSLKLDEKQFDSCLLNTKYNAKIEEDLQDGMRAGVRGTPGFLICGVLSTGTQPQATFERIIQAEITPTKDRSLPHQQLKSSYIDDSEQLAGNVKIFRPLFCLTLATPGLQRLIFRFV